MSPIMFGNAYRLNFDNRTIKIPKDIAEVFAEECDAERELSRRVVDILKKERNIPGETLFTSDGHFLITNGPTEDTLDILNTERKKQGPPATPQEGLLKDIEVAKRLKEQGILGPDKPALNINYFRMKSPKGRMYTSFQNINQFTEAIRGL